VPYVICEHCTLQTYSLPLWRAPRRARGAGPSFRSRGALRWSCWTITPTAMCMSLGAPRNPSMSPCGQGGVAMADATRFSQPATNVR
jgi:hypothetical protein